MRLWDSEIFRKNRGGFMAQNNDYSILNQNKIYEVPADTIIVNEGEINLDMYKILSGHAEMYTGYGTDKEVLIGILGPGTCFGEFGLLTRKAAIYTIVSFSKMKILRIMEGHIGGFIKEDPASILQIMRNMANNMMRMQHQINQLSQELAEINNETNPEKVDDAVNKMVKDNLRNYAIKGTKDSDDKEHGMRFINSGGRK